MAARKKPGRPRKRTDSCPIGQQGIVANPINDTDCVELVYNQPQMLKYIVSLFRGYDTSEITIEFAPETITFSGRDHTERVEIRITIVAADMNMYYFMRRETIAAAGDSYNIVVKRDNLEIVTAIIEKSHYKMMLALHRENLSNLYVVFNSCEYDSEDCFDICIVPGARCIGTECPDVAKYPLEFTLDSRHLHKKVDELRKITTNVVIKKIGSSDLELTFESNSHIGYAGIYRAPPKIKLRSDIPDNGQFIATMDIGCIRPLLAINNPGNITFYINNTDPIVIKIGLDARADQHFAITVNLLVNARKGVTDYS